jgi:hypothetical protein
LLLTDKEKKLACLVIGGETIVKTPKWWLASTILMMIYDCGEVRACSDSTKGAEFGSHAPSFEL